jgi:hypothetical protein
MQSLSSVLLSVVVCLLLAISCEAQCSGSVFTPNTTTAPSDGSIGPTGNAYNSSLMLLMPVQLLQSAVVTGVSIFPWTGQSGVLSIAGGLFSYAAGSGNMTVVAQSRVVTVTDFTPYNVDRTPLSLPFPQSVFAMAGDYRVVWWFTWQPAQSGKMFSQRTVQGLPATWLFYPWQINSSDFTTANGVMPNAFQVTPDFTGTYGDLVSVQTSIACPSSTGYSSSTGPNAAPHAAAASAALPLTFAAVLLAVWAVMSS